MIEHAIRTNADFICGNRRISNFKSLYNRFYFRILRNLFGNNFFDVESQFCMFSKDALTEFMNCNGKNSDYLEVILRLYKKKYVFQSINVAYQPLPQKPMSLLASIEKSFKLFYRVIKFTVS